MNKPLHIAVFLNFIGFYVCVLFVFLANFSHMSTFVTIPIRILILVCLYLAFRKERKVMPDVYTWLFLFFSLMVIARIFVDELKGVPYYLSFSKVLQYFFSFTFLPFVLLSLFVIKLKEFKTIKYAIIISGFLFAIVSTFYLQRFIGAVGRLTATEPGEAVVSPLILSYCSIMSIGVCISHWMENKVGKFEKVFLLITILLSSTPFFLGASRGSLIALLIPFLIIVALRKGIVKNVKTVFFIILAVIGIIVGAEYTGSNLIDRFTNTKSDMEQGDDSAIRTTMWKNSLGQFANYPVFGERLKTTGFDIYPHNVFLEVLQTTGLLGFIPFLILVIAAFAKSLKIIRNYPAYSWLFIIFLQSFFQNMVTGTMFMASWLMVSMALIFSFSRSLEQESLN